MLKPAVAAVAVPGGRGGRLTVSRGGQGVEEEVMDLVHVMSEQLHVSHVLSGTEYLACLEVPLTCHAVQGCQEG